MESTKSTQRIEPVRKSVTVDAPVEHAFRVFTERTTDWWPLGTHSVREELAQAAVIEPRAGGAVYELWRNGREEWGRVTAWEPPHRLVFTWHPGRGADEATEVEVRFSEQGGSTLVELEHRGWEARGEQAPAVRSAYQTGWDPVLARYAEAAAG